MSKFEFNSLDEELQFLRKVVNSTPFVIHVDQIDEINDISKFRSIWSSQQTNDLYGYTRDEITRLGFDFFKETIHPDDVELIGSSLDKIMNSNVPVYGGMIRLRAKNGEYQWHVGSMSLMERKDGRPWRVIVCVQNLEQFMDTRNQILQLIRENLQLKNQLRMKNLGKREIQIVKLIAKGCTDKEIAEKLSISPATVKTHRHNIIQKLHLKNKAAIAQFATESGLD
jgi:DNA-binding CsgD family transcriptional regulator